jgi:crotonobetainyl-CoA:carnitine CoA-transferase CaiB-like acyl-CoA transferase
MVVATAVTLGLAAVARCGVGQQVFVDMFGANAYANFDDFVAYPGKPQRQQPDPTGYGLSEYQRLYQCADGWVFLAVVTPADHAAWSRAADELALVQDELAGAFRLRSTSWWIKTLAAEGISCVRADAGLPAQCLLAERLVVAAHCSAWGDYLRHAPVLEFPGVVDYGGTCRAGEHTEVLLAEFGDAAHPSTRRVPD